LKIIPFYPLFGVEEYLLLLVFYFYHMDLIGFIETWFQIVILDNVKLAMLSKFTSHRFR